MRSFIINEDGQQTFSISFLAFMTFYKRWEKKKKELEKVYETDPSKIDLVKRSIQRTEALRDNFYKAAMKYKVAAMEIKQKFDDYLGPKDKVKKFFGFGSDKADKKLLKLEGGKFTDGNVYSIKDVLSPDFDIVPFYGTPEKAKQDIFLMLQYTKIIKKEKGLQTFVDSALEELSSNSLSQFMSANGLTNLEESLNIEKFENEMNRLYAEVFKKKIEIVKQFEEAGKFTRNIKIKMANEHLTEPIIMLRYEFGQNESLMAADPFLKIFENPSLKVQDSKLLDLLKQIADNMDIKVEEGQLSRAVKEKKWDSIEEIFEEPEDKKYKKKYGEIFKKFEERIKIHFEEAQKNPPILSVQKDDFGDIKDISFNKVYKDKTSLLIRQLQRSQDSAKAVDYYQYILTYGDKEAKEWMSNTLSGLNIKDIEEVKKYLSNILKAAAELNNARDREIVRDLEMLKMYYKKQGSNRPDSLYRVPGRRSSNQKQGTKIAQEIDKVLKLDSERILKYYAQWNEWMVENKSELIKYFEQNDNELEESLINILKPFLARKLKKNNTHLLTFFHRGEKK